jgi:6-phosphogluconolactonase
LRPSPDSETLVYVGTYTHGKSEGIYLYRLDATIGALVFVSLARTENPSFLAIDPKGNYLYAVNESAEFRGQPGGGVTAFAIHPRTGELTYLNDQPSHGSAPCHVSLDKSGRYAFVANYGNGSLAVFPIQDDGRLGVATDVIQHPTIAETRATEVATTSTKAPHAHSVTVDAANRFAFAADLGLDRLMVYRLDTESGKLVAHEVPWVQLEAGAGPRHFAFHPNGRYAYAIRELDSRLTVMAYDSGRGVLTAVQTVPTLPLGYSGTNYCADVHVAPSGRFIYGSNRGHDSIVIFAVDEATGKLSYVGHEPTRGKTPRNFAIDPTGSFLLVANQHSDTIVTFRIEQHTGQLEPTGHMTEVPAPVCLKMMRMHPHHQE